MAFWRENQHINKMVMVTTEMDDKENDHDEEE